MRQAATTGRQAGDEPVPGYRLLEPLGQGGFGEVWKCEVPGGLYKAIKFVRYASDGGHSPAAQEHAALQRVKTLRHPFVLSLDRVEEVDGTLVIIMELADENLHSLAARCRAQGLPGVPREDLLAYLSEAAEALDWMNFDHGLQHLDVKPHNLFVVSKHVKVADFGLVHSLGDSSGGQGPAREGGVTPLYSAPELLRGTLSRTSDQYSLAVVYQQMLTGTVPFFNENVYDLMMQHLTGDPDLSALPEGDRPIVLRALSKVPEQRYPSCTDFIQALMQVPGQSKSVRRSGQWRRILQGPTPTTPLHEQKTQITTPPDPPAVLTTTPTRRVRAVSRESTPSAPSGLEQTTFVPSGPPVHEPSPPPGGTGHAPAPTAVSLPGYRFLNCVSQNALGDQWVAEDAQGRPRRALAVLNFVRYDARLINHLQALRDPALPLTEVHWSPAERLVILTDPYEGTLRDRFEQCKAEGLPGIPRAELLRLLRSAAESLDGLYARHGLQHLGIHPRNLLVDGDLLRVGDFGVIPLVWLPTGESAAALNGKYAAPELFDRRPSRTADQYSLALVYAEMLTGVHPRPSRPGSGLHRRPILNGPRAPQPPARPSKIDLDLLPAHDREVMQRALSNDPEKRFGSAVELIAALETATAEGGPPPDLYETLPSVIPYASLMGEPPGPDTIMPPVAQLVATLTQASDPRVVKGPENVRYNILPNGTWEYRCPLQLFPGAMALKVEGLQTYWAARIARQDGDSYHLEIEVPVARSFWDRFRTPKRVELSIFVEPSTLTGVRQTEAVVQLRYEVKDRDQSERVLATMGPKVLASVRQFLQAAPEQRMRERVPLAVPVRAYPVLPDLELAEVIEGTTRNLSSGGISFRAAKRPPVEWLYLHLHSSPQTLGYAVLARVVRCQETPEGSFEVGAVFPARG